MHPRILISLALASVVAACGGASSSESSTTVTVDEPATTQATEGTTTTSAPGSTAGETTTITTTAPDPYLFEIEVIGGEVAGGGSVDVPLGETVTFRVTADVADELHVHGYDLLVDLQPGVTGEISFETTIPGIVEIELEEAGLVLVALQSS